MDLSVRICSLNINGMRDSRKRAQLFAWLRLKKFDIVFLQETHCSSYRDAQLWQNEWGGLCFWSFGGNKSRGTAIMFREGLSFERQMLYYDAVGRLVILDVKLHECTYRLINVYAPNNHAERVPWLNELHRWFVGDKLCILGGDFNCVENQRLDKVGGNVEYGAVGGDVLGTFRNNYRLIDVYRACYPRDVGTSWTSADGSVSCRLDRFYVSAQLKQCSSVYMFPCSLSDHSAVELTLAVKAQQNSKGRSYWKCNTKILDDTDFVADLQDLCDNCMQAETKDAEWWESCKVQFKRLIILHSCRLSQNYRTRLQAFEAELRVLQAQNLRNPGSNAEEIKIIKSKISDLLSEKLDGAKVRSRAKYLDTEETPSSYFLRREKQNAAKSTISELSISARKITETAEILHECRNYYAELYASESVDSNVMSYLLGLVNKLPSSILGACDGPVTVQECTSAIHSMENNKTPGSDGLPKEFYAKFFHMFSAGFVSMLNHSFESGLLPPSLRHGIITLACKDINAADVLSNWRPISLLNVDYKILAKVLSKRLSAVLPQCIHPDQTCAVPGRSIQDNLHLFRNVTDYANDTDRAAAIVSYDQAKAFDRVSHEYLFNVLSAFGFSKNFVNWVSLLYTDISSCVIVNGFISSTFAVLQSIRQGCPLSALLYALCIEPLAIGIRQDSAITGLRLPGTTERVRLALYADDTNSFISSEREIEATLHWFKIYGLASGAKLNNTKCKGLWLGAWRNRTDHPFGFVWSDTLKINGVYFGVNSSFQNASMLLQKVDKMCDAYRSRHLTLIGRACIANIVICAQLWYVGAVAVLPDTLITEINRKIFAFIWTGKFEAVSRRTLTTEQNKGGLGLVHITLKLESLRCAHLRKLVAGTEAKWKHCAVYWTGLQLRRYDSSFASLLIPHAEQPSEFYNKTLDTFRKLTALSAVVEPQDLKARLVYRKLQATEFSPPVVIDKFPHVDFFQAFTNLNSRLVHPRARELE